MYISFLNPDFSGIIKNINPICRPNNRRSSTAVYLKLCQQARERPELLDYFIIGDGIIDGDWLVFHMRNMHII